MATSFQKPVDIFLGRIEKDIDFFRYIGLDDEEAAKLAARRSKDILLQANAALTLRCKSDIDFTDVDEGNDVYTADLNSNEIYLVGSMMYEIYLQKDIAKIKLDNVNYTASELQVFDPSNARSTFMSIYETIVAENKLLIAEYRDTDRKTGKYLGIDYASYDEEGSE